MSVVLLLLLGFLMHAARSFSSGTQMAGSSGASLALGYMLLTAFFAGGIFKSIRLPKLTGYIAAGILVGPQVLGLVTERMVTQLGVVNGMAIALIALTAGAEMDLKAMRPLLRSIAVISLIAITGTAIVLSLLVFALRPLLPFFEGMPLMAAAAISLVLGVVLTAQSPAVVVALRDELEADGPVSRTVLGVVVAGDLLVIVLFAGASTLGRSMLGGAVAAGGNLAWELLGSLLVGGVLGLVLALYLSRVEKGAELFLLMMAFVCAEVGARVHLDPLLLALGAGLVVRNFSKQGDRLHQKIEASALPVYLLFFATAGASIHLDVLGAVGIPAALIVVTRGVSLLSGTRFAARAAGAAPEVTRWAGYGLLPQAGLALALSLLFVKSFPEFGEHARALTLGVVALNELLAPVVYRWSLMRAGEAGVRSKPEAEDDTAPVPANATG